MMRADVLFAYEADDVKPGWVALVLVLGLAVATFLLWRSMNKQLGKINVPTQQEIRDAEAAGQEPGDSAEPPRGEPDGDTEEERPPGE